MSRCEECNSEHDGTYGSGRFCSKKCAHIRKHSPDSNALRSLSLRKKKYVFRECKTCHSSYEAPVDRNTSYCNFKCYQNDESKPHPENTPDSIWEANHQKIAKVLKLMGESCSRCGWKETSCDLHHIAGRKIENPHAHSNLTLLCPNCHRLFHKGLIGPDDVVSLEKLWGNAWKEFYWGAP